jgi:hypothetical protein
MAYGRWPLRVAHRLSRIAYRSRFHSRFAISDRRYALSHLLYAISHRPRAAAVGGWLAAALAVSLAAACAAPTPAPPTTTAPPTQTAPPTATLPPSATPGPSATPSATPLPSPTTVPSPVPGGLYVDAAQTLGPVSPYLFGTNYGPWAAVPFDQLDAALHARVTAIRFPGGAYGDRNKLTPLQIDQFAAFLQQMGAIGTISVNLRGGTPEQAAELVRYANVERGYGIRYWSIGNEPTLYQAQFPTTAYTVADYNADFRAFAEAMRAVDPTIQLMGPEVNQFTGNPAANPKDSTGADWMTEFLRANGGLVDVVTIHRYPYGKEKATVSSLRANSREWDDTIPYLRGLIHAETGRDLPIAVTEFNSDWAAGVGGEAPPASHHNALWLADVLGRLIRHDVLMANQFALAEAPGTFGLGLLSRDGPHPSYWVYQMYAMFGRERVYASSDEPLLPLYAARRDDGALTLMVINLASEPMDTTLRLDHLAPAGPAETWLFDAEHQAARVDDTPLAAETALHVPAEAMLLLVVK